MTFTTLQTEFYARGFDYLNDGGAGATRAKAFINTAYHELVEEELWPFRYTTASGSSPLTITDLGTVASVVDTVGSRALVYRDRRTLVGRYIDLTTTGTPVYFYMPDGTGVSTYPVGGTLAVAYYKAATDLSAGSDNPIVPARFQPIIIDGAVRLGLVDSDDFDASQAVERERQIKLDRMRRVLLGQQTQDDQVLVDVGSGGDW